MPVAKLPNPLYYLDNFQFVLRWVAQRYAGLLNDTECSFIHAFLALDQASRALLVRMVMRKGSLFRASRLSYTEIGPTQLAMTPLLDLGWVHDQPDITLEDLFRLLTRADLTQLFGPRLAAQELKAATKAAQLAHLQGHALVPRPLAAWLDEAGLPPHHPLGQERIYQIKPLALCDRLRLMFFGNLRQDWSEFILADLGLYTYENVPFPESARAFVSRQDIDDYLHLHQCRESLELAQDQAACADVIASIPAQPYASDWLESRRARLLYCAGQSSERQQNWQQAIACYAASTERNARARHIRMLERLDQLPQALALAHNVLQQPHTEAEHQTVRRMLPRLQKRCGHPAARRSSRCAAHTTLIELHTPTHPTRVEEEVRAHLHQADAPVFYVENTLFNALFGLLCWQAVFASIPGAFFHPFQHGPADLLHDNFHERRRPLFDDCLAQLSHSGYRHTILHNFEAKYGMQSPFVAWGALTPALLTLALDCIPASHLYAVFTRLLDDIRENRSGLPDLIQFWPKDAHYRLIEVKGPGDRLQDNQLRWLAYCETHGIDTLVCHVQRPVAT